MDPPQISYLDHNSILVINPIGKMRQLHAPFRVQVIQDTTILKRNTWVVVEEIMPHNQSKLLYRITTHWWPYNIFRNIQRIIEAAKYLDICVQDHIIITFEQKYFSFADDGLI